MAEALQQLPDEAGASQVAPLPRPPYEPTYEDEIMIAARQVTPAAATRWQSGQAPPQRLTRSQMLASISPEDRTLLNSIWPELDRTERRQLILSRYFRLNVDQIASATRSNTGAVLAAMHKIAVLMENDISILPPDLGEPTARKNPPNPPLEALSEALSGEPVMISESPRTVIFWEGEDKEPAASGAHLGSGGRMTGFHFGEAIVRINKEEPFTQADKCAVLASLGLPSADIAKLLFIGENTVKTHLKRTFRNLGINSRSAIAAAFMENGVYSIVRALPKPPWNTARKRDICIAAAQGLGNKAIGAQIYITEDTVKGHFRHISSKSGLRTREQIALATLLANRGTGTKIAPGSNSGIS